MTDNERTERERVARAICVAEGNDPDAGGSGWCDDPDWRMWRRWEEAADAAIAALRPTDSELVERLEWLASDDHERGCQGRYYTCDCGHEARIDEALREAATALRAQSEGEAEREAIVAFIRARWESGELVAGDELADAIEAGQHKGTGRG